MDIIAYRYKNIMKTQQKENQMKIKNKGSGHELPLSNFLNNF